MSEVAGGKVVKLIAEDEIKDSMADPRFYEQLPEFLPLRAKMGALHDDIVTPHGCSNCAKNRVYRSIGGDFLSIVSTFTGKPDAAARLRRYFGADELRANVLDPNTRQMKNIKI